MLFRSHPFRFALLWSLATTCGKVKPSTPQDSRSGLWQQLVARLNLPPLKICVSSVFHNCQQTVHHSDQHHPLWSFATHGKVKSSTPQDSCFSGLSQPTSLYPLILDTLPEVCFIFNSTWVFILKPALQQHSLSWLPKSTLHNLMLAH